MKGPAPPRRHSDGSSYSPRWYAVFLDTITDEQTEHEAAFVARRLPLPRFRRIVDLCCGSGRHGRALGALGYDVTGVDVDEAALAKAAAGGQTVRYVRGDMRQLAGLGLSADAVICLWQSFGHFDEAVNADVLRQMAATVGMGGRVLLDVYNREFFASRTGERTLTRGGETVEETSWLVNGRLTVDLRYGDGSTDRFVWQLYAPDELESLGSAVGLHLVESFASFDESQAPSETQARMQLVFERG